LVLVKDNKRSKAAFIHTGAWGDLYVSLAALQVTCQRHVTNGVVLVGSAKWKDIIKKTDWPAVEEIWECDNGRSANVYTWSAKQNDWQLSLEGVPLSVLFKKVIRSYNARTESLRYAFAPLIARVPERFGSAPWPLSKLFFTHPSKWLGKDPIIHERDRILQVVIPAQSETQVGLPPLRQTSHKTLRELFGDLKQPYILVNPTASRREKAWPSAKFRELVERISAEFAQRGQKIQVHLVGAQSETQWLEECLPKPQLPTSDSERDNSQTANPETPTLLLQPRRILDAVELIAGAELLVANTSSLQFLAAGVKTPVVTLMGRGTPEIWGPLGEEDIVIRGEVSADADNDIFKQERLAYESIPVERVFKVVMGFFDQQETSSTITQYAE